MAKRKETLEIEDKLRYMCRKRRIYGCEEITIGFYNNGHGNEIVDFCTMDSKGILRCYEIKVTLADLKSKAKKSWYGHFNYLFVTRELYQKICDHLEEFIPDYVGVAVPCPDSWSDGVEIVKNPKKQDLSTEQEIMLKESMVRSMYYKIQKYRDAADLKKVSMLQSELRRERAENAKFCNEVGELRFTISKIERVLRLYGKEFSLRDFTKALEDGRIILPEKIELSLTETGKRIFKKRKIRLRDRIKEVLHE